MHYSGIGLLRVANDQRREAAYYFSASDAGVLSIAGLWDEWNDITSGEPLLSCTMIVTESNELAGRIHDRMPVFLAGDSFEAWLDGSSGVELLCSAPENLGDCTVRLPRTIRNIAKVPSKNKDLQKPVAT